jgi:hypothetical protein
MEIKLFTDVLDASKQVVKDIVGLKNVGANERQRYYETIEETYRLLDTSLLLVVARLGDIVNKDAEGRPGDATSALVSLDNADWWYEREQEFGLCSNLRRLRNEMDTLSALPGPQVVKDWANLKMMIDGILHNERQLADYIAQTLHYLAAWGRMPSSSYGQAIAATRQAHAVLLAQHRDFIRQQRDIMDRI